MTTNIDTIRRAIAASSTAGLRVHHVEVGSFLWHRLAADLAKCELRDDIGYGTRPGGKKAPILDGVVLVPGTLASMDQWALIFGLAGDAATDYALTAEHRRKYEEAIARGELHDWKEWDQAHVVDGPSCGANVYVDFVDRVRNRALVDNGIGLIWVNVDHLRPRDTL